MKLGEWGEKAKALRCRGGGGGGVNGVWRGQLGSQICSRGAMQPHGLRPQVKERAAVLGGQIWNVERSRWRVGESCGRVVPRRGGMSCDLTRRMMALEARVAPAGSGADVVFENGACLPRFGKSMMEKAWWKRSGER